MHRRLADDGGEPIGEPGTGHGHAVREFVDGPGMGGSAVDETEPAANRVVAEACEPARLARRKRLDVAAEDFDEHELGHIHMMMDEGEDNVKAAYRDNYSRLAAIKKAVDPENHFRINQNIKPA
jgi:hypothetical protein